MKAQILTKFALSVICCGGSIGWAGDPLTDEPAIRPHVGPTVEATDERLPPTSSSDAIVIRRRVYRNESLAELGARLYDQVDYDLKLRQLTRDIRVAEAELDLFRERQRAYDKHFGYTDALLVTRQNAKLDVVRTEEQLKLLRRAKLLALRHRNDQVRYRELLLAEGAARLQQ